MSTIHPIRLDLALTAEEVWKNIGAEQLRGKLWSKYVADHLVEVERGVLDMAKRRRDAGESSRALFEYSWRLAEVTLEVEERRGTVEAVLALCVWTPELWAIFDDERCRS